MAVTISLVVIFGLIVYGLLRDGSLSYAPAFFAVMFGFFLASTGASGPINDITASVIHSLQQHL
ncbi:hypothetical protein [Streptomyces colonosanans]|uniref:Uncharacterized protein n=1 Tax=Streptomyces colonosanans TaxID=1428652 RepID=A0A1S2P813_9ACTN|nr:hypothetical protein [Streptomyces colonosanans]OIJ89767.1 hypothetical protein BIV24_19300 [Streptomyces colonosanans]